ncbi:hypothetical protein K461DRAFT_281239 [Myriangium duriaei CBS 260.36]|uniref:Uncharacterized protein n=1 Tax=Myriangium duriaei CBS 260.36 TaxID=1168546 RepID=A0A9P4MJN3_9PEZI|nr:hypothetical protein K461DRAFT_281239 [Myriangium duriaei CBS 260.36]
MRLSTWLPALLYTWIGLTSSLPTTQIPLLSSQPPRSPSDPYHIPIPIDHFSSLSNHTYLNRYWLNTTFYRPGGPIFLYDAGERGVPSRGPHPVFPPTHPVLLLAKRFSGLALLWEHRFYGLSLPVPLFINATPAELQNAYAYLATEQALEDTVYLARHFQPEGLERYWEGLKPESTPWIWVGGSYPGARGAMVRARNPDVFRAAWASSASVEVHVAFPEYHLQIAKELPAHCRQTIQGVVRYADGVMQHGTILAKVQLRWEIARRFRGQSAWNRAAFVAFGTWFHVGRHLQNVVASDWQWKGWEGRMGVTCAALEDVRLDDVDTALGKVLDAIEANNADYEDNIGKAFYPLDGQTWQYQVCTEYPFFRTAANDEDNVLSEVVTAENIWANGCKLQFPWLKFPPDTSAQMRYTNWNHNVSNVMWTTGFKDPWHGLSMVPKKSLVPGAPTNRTTTKKVPACNVPMEGDKVFGLTFEEGRHCDDLYPGGKETALAVNTFSRALDEWLPCFRAQRTPSHDLEQSAVL